MNKVTLIGRTTKSPELRYAPGTGTAVCKFTLAVPRAFKKDEADFINCVIWRKAAESFANYARKGTLIGLTGRIQTRNYDNQQGQRVYVTEIVVENFQLLESKEVNEQRRSSKPEQATFDKQATDKPDPLDPFSKDVSPIDISDDDLPF